MIQEDGIANAVRHFWETRAAQRSRQGAETGQHDQGNRTAVTGGKQLDGFVNLVTEMLVGCGLSDAHVHTRKRDVALPGFFRPVKEWDLVVVYLDNLIATIEFKSQVGSFGNNFNNRIEEALGNALDIQTAYREGAFASSPAPWIGYLMMLEERGASTRGVSVSEPHFNVFDEFRDTSYLERYELFCKRLVRERLYNAACFLTSNRKSGLQGKFSEPAKELCFGNFAGSLIGHVSGAVRAAR